MSAMPALPMKAEYAPTLGQLLAPRWHAASLRGRAVALAAVVAVVTLALAVGVTLENAHYSHGAPVPFSFAYRDLYRVKPDPGGYVKVQSRYRDGALRYSYAVDPLRLPPYSGESSGELPIYAAGYERTLSRTHSGFNLAVEGKTMINSTQSGYQLAYEAEVEGQRMWVRDIMLVPGGAGVRDGVMVVAMSAPDASKTVLSPREVASVGVLLRPVKTFAFG